MPKSRGLGKRLIMVENRPKFHVEFVLQVGLKTKRIEMLITLYHQDNPRQWFVGQRSGKKLWHCRSQWFRRWKRVLFPFAFHCKACVQSQPAYSHLFHNKRLNAQSDTGLMQQPAKKRSSSQAYISNKWWEKSLPPRVSWMRERMLIELGYRCDRILWAKQPHFSRI